MVEAQSTDEVLELLMLLVGETVAELQVLGINSLKSVVPSPADLIGQPITGVSADNRLATLQMGALTATVDLQRTGKVHWLDAAERARIGRTALPTLRLILASGAGMDFSEPAKTKRISVQIRAD